MRMLLAVLLLACAAVGQQPTTMPASTLASTTQQTVDDVISVLQEKLDSVQTVQAEFSQEQKLAMFKKAMVIRGHFALKRPKLLVWHVVEPVKYSIKIEDDTIRQWDEDTGRVQQIDISKTPSLKAVFSQFQAWFMGDYRSMGQSYDIVVLGQDPVQLRCRPKPDGAVAKLIAQVDVTFSIDQRHIDTVMIQETAGDTTTIRFSGARLNEPVDAGVWEVPPHGRR